MDSSQQGGGVSSMTSSISVMTTDAPTASSGDTARPTGFNQNSAPTSSPSATTAAVLGSLLSYITTTNNAMVTYIDSVYALTNSSGGTTAITTITGEASAVTSPSAPSRTTSLTISIVGSTTPMISGSTASVATGIRSSSTPSPVITMKSSNNSSLSSGATAGIAIGCAIIGALIGALLVGIFMRRHNQKSRSAGAVYEGVQSRNPPERNEKIYATNIAMTRPSGSIDSILPLPVETNYLTRELSTLKTLIREHVSNFYGTDHAGGQSTIFARSLPALDEYTTSSPFQGSRQLLEAVADPRTRVDTLRYLIALVVLQNVEQSGNGASDPLLPLGTACCLGNMSSAGFNGSRSDYNKLRSRWRVITGYLQEGHYKRQDFSEADDRTANVQSVCQTLNTVLAAYAIPAREAERQKHLLQVVRRASAFGTTLAAQPNAYQFFWDHQGGLVVFPSLLQESDEFGVELRQPRELGERERAHGFPQR